MIKNIDVFKPSSIVLVLANLAILSLSIFLGLDTYNVLLIFWLESAVIGLFFVLRLPFIIGIFSILLIPPFVVYTAIFMLVHLMFLSLFFSTIYDPQLIDTMKQAIDIFFKYWFTILILFFSHGFSYVSNFLKNKEYIKYKKSREKLNKLIWNFGKRMSFMHTSMITLGFLGVFLGLNSLLVVFIIVISKTIFDLRSHIAEHKIS